MNNEQRENIKSVMKMLSDASAITDAVQTDVADRTEHLPKGSEERNVMDRIDLHLIQAYVHIRKACEALDSALDV